MPDEAASGAPTPPMLDGPTPAQVKMREARAMLPGAGMRPEEEVLEDRFADLYALIEENMPAELAGRYADAITQVREDQTYGGVRYLGFLRAPGSRCGAYACEGGLVRRVLVAWRLWENLRGGGEADGLSFRADPHVTDARVLEGLIGRQIGRAWAHYVVTPLSEEEWVAGLRWKVRQGRHEADLLMPGALKAVYLLQKADICLDPEGLHVLAAEDPGRAGPEPGRAMSALARVCLAVDDMAVQLERVRTGRVLDRDRVAGTAYLSPRGEAPAP